MSPPSYEDLFAAARDFQVKHKTEFVTEAGEAMRMVVRQDVKGRLGMKQFGLSVLVFDFEPAGAITTENSPTASGRLAPASGSSTADAAVAAVAGASAREAAAEGGGEGAEGATAAAAAAAAAGGEAEGEERGTVVPATSLRRGQGCVVLVHDRWNGHKELYRNHRLVYSVKKECSDGNLNSWVIPLPFGRVVLKLTNKFFSLNGFEYLMTLHDGGSVLFKSN